MKPETRNHAFALFVFLALAFWSLVFGQAADKPKAEQVRIGMTVEEVRNLLGAPRRTARQILYHRHFELWTYEVPAPIWIEFTCVRGQESRVSRVYHAETRP